MNPPIDITGLTLNTERLLLRPFRESDLEDLYAYASVEGVGEWAGWKHHESREESAQILSMFMEEKKTFALEYQGRVVGSLGIERYKESQFPEYDALRCREIGFVLAKDCWGKGLMPEAVRAVLRWLFCDVGLDAVFCAHAKNNARSARVQAKCGFVHLASGTYETRMGTTVEDEVNILTKKRWEALEEA